MLKEQGCYNKVCTMSLKSSTSSYSDSDVSDNSIWYYSESGKMTELSELYEELCQTEGWMRNQRWRPVTGGKYYSLYICWHQNSTDYTHVFKVSFILMSDWVLSCCLILKTWILPLKISLISCAQAEIHVYVFRTAFLNFWPPFASDSVNDVIIGKYDPA